MGKLATERLPDVVLVSTITLAELSLGPLLARSDAELEARQRHLEMAESVLKPLPFDERAARTFAGVAASMRRAGRTPAARSFDALIAAVAIANDLPLHTCNPEDYTGIEGLDLVAVPHPGHPESPPSK